MACSLLHIIYTHSYEVLKGANRMKMPITATVKINHNNHSKNLFDSEGYLKDKYNWSESLASQIADKNGISQLTDKHLRVIAFIRDYHNRFSVMPPPRRVCRQLGIEGHDVKMLFGSCLTAWRIAGLPSPNDEIKAHIH